MGPSWVLYSLRLFACLVLAVALFSFCNGYQEVKFLEIVNKCLEGDHNPMCEGFLEQENKMNDYKTITVQEDMYADRTEWIPKKMNPSQEYVTLISILERHPCQSLRCLDKLTAQIYGGEEGYNVGPQKHRNKSVNGRHSGRKLEDKPEYKDRIDDVLKEMGKYGEAIEDLRAEVIKSNKEYLVIDNSFEARANESYYARHGDKLAHRKKRDTTKLLERKAYPAHQVLERDRKISTTSFTKRFGLKPAKELFDRADSLIENQESNLEDDDSDGKGSIQSKDENSSARKAAPNTGKESEPAQECSSVITSNRFDCYPEAGASEEACLGRGCCWIPLPDKVNSSSSRKDGKPTPYIRPPSCYYPPSYTSYHVIHHQETPTGQEALLQLLRPSGHPDDHTELRLQVFYETESRLKIQITPITRHQPYRPVLPLTSRSSGGAAGLGGSTASGQQLLRFSLTQQNAAITVTRTDTNTTVFSTAGTAPMVFARQFIQLSSVLASSHIYGLGQHLDGLLLDVGWTRYTMWNVDQFNIPGSNLYSSHPFYLVMEEGGSCYGVYLHSSNALGVTLQPSPAITLHSTGEEVTLYVFAGPSPTSVIRQYTQLVGRPAMPPYWALGYHQCRFGYGSTEGTREVWQRTRDAGIPFDVQWNDIDYMDNRNDFTYDHDKYAGLPEFVDELHEVGMHYVVIIDPGISASEPADTYPPWDEGEKMGIFIRNSTGQVFLGKVWNEGATAWPDFSHPRALYYWARQIVRFHGLVPIDGAWIDMNEPSNFYSGTEDGCDPSSPLNEPPFVPSGLMGGKLYYKTVCGDARQYLDNHYNLHNLYGIMEAVATNVALKVTRGERPLVIGRATTPGQGMWSGHWTGDVESDWDNLRASVPDVLNFNLFGIPLVGADMCGFNGNTTAALCLRWMQLGAFYPFARNHNTDDGVAQDPVAQGEDVVVASRNALMERYRLLPYLYTLFYKAYITGDTVARPLFVQFPEDPATYSISSQFLWGDGLMIIPAMEENVTTVHAYLPCGSVWYDWYSGIRIGDDEQQRREPQHDQDARIEREIESREADDLVNGDDGGPASVGDDSAENGDDTSESEENSDEYADFFDKTNSVFNIDQGSNARIKPSESNDTDRKTSQPGCYYIELSAPLDRIPLLIRGGSVLPTQLPAVTTTESRLNPFSVEVALDMAGEAVGQLYLDDGVSLEPVRKEEHTVLEFRAGDRQLIISCLIAHYNGDMTLDGVRVMGVSGVVESVTVNGEPKEFEHDSDTQVLTVTSLNWNLPLYFDMKW